MSVNLQLFSCYRTVTTFHYRYPVHHSTSQCRFALYRLPFTHFTGLF